MELTTSKDATKSDDLMEAMGTTHGRFEEIWNKLVNSGVKGENEPEEMRGFENKSTILKRIIEIAETPEEIAIMVTKVAYELACIGCPIKSDPMGMLVGLMDNLRKSEG